MIKYVDKIKFQFCNVIKLGKELFVKNQFIVICFDFYVIDNIKEKRI